MPWLIFTLDIFGCRSLYFGWEINDLRLSGAVSSQGRPLSVTVHLSRYSVPEYSVPEQAHCTCAPEQVKCTCVQCTWAGTVRLSRYSVPVYSAPEQVLSTLQGPPSLSLHSFCCSGKSTALLHCHCVSAELLQYLISSAKLGWRTAVKQCTGLKFACVCLQTRGNCTTAHFLR